MPTPDVMLRPATLDDAEALAAVFVEARAAAVPSMPPAVHGEAEARLWYAEQLADGVHEAWVAQDDTAVRGFALMTSTWLDQLYVAPHRQGDGIGGALLELVKSLHPDGFGLWVFETNTSARAFYAAHGLVEVERTDGSQNEERAPDIRMVWPVGGGWHTAKRVV